MAYQHFYSRVPARISLYNKIDGFDTFAHSAELDREFILGELYPIYADKLDKNNPVKIRQREIPTVYTQTMLPSGRTVQSALSYLPLDYTRERSAYMVHSLVLTDEERRILFANPKAAFFNPDMFITDISAFNITSPSAAPNPALAHKQYIPRALSSVARVSARYNPEMLARLLFAVVLALCGKGKDVYIRLPFDDKRTSIEALELISSIMNVLPYNLRELLSFVTYVSNYNNYPGFKLKCISADCPASPPSKGVFFDFTASTISGMGTEIDMNRPLVSFLYSLFDNPTVRDAFHVYVAAVLATYEDKTLNLSTLNELVFLFWQCSGFYVEESVLPNDALMCDFFSIYEKYREALTDDYRKQAYKCLERYAKNHAPIPNSIFEKLEHLYPAETVAAKRVALGVVLRLIHTDVMREKLFVFIRNNYDAETPEVKSIVNEDLSRVFYGGFLQSEILDFYDKNFDLEPVKTQNVILHKLFLSIRTPSIQEKIVSFFDDHYDRLSWEQKLRVYSTAMEMIPECDRLTSMLVWLINKHIGKEREELLSTISGKIAEYLSQDYKRDVHLLLPLLVYSPGFLDDVVIKLVCTHWKESIVNYEYTRLLDARSSYYKAKKLMYIYKAVPDMEGEVFLRLIYGCSTTLLDTEATLYDFITLEEELRLALPEQFYTVICERVLYPAVVYSFYDVFKVKYGKDGIDLLIKYVQGKRLLAESEQYGAVLRYVELTKCAEAEDATGVFENLESLPEDKKTRIDVSDHIRMCSLNRNTQTPKTALIYELSINYLKTGSFRFDIVYQQYKNSVYSQITEDDDSISPEKADKISSAASIELILECATEMCAVSEEYVDMICDDASGFQKAMKSFIITYGLGVGRFLSQRTEDAPFCVVDLVNELVKEYKPQGREIIERLLGKK